MSSSDIFSDNKTVTLSQDSNMWSDQIITQLTTNFPELSKLVGDITFTKVDPIKRNAVGYIALVGKKQRIPFIIDSGVLNPLDMYIDNTNYFPLTENSVKKIGNNVWPFKLISQKERSQIIKTASLYEDSGNINVDFISNHKEELEKIAEEYPDIIRDISHKPSMEQEEFVVRCFVKEASSSKPIVTRDLIHDDKEYSMPEFAAAFGKDFVRQLMYEKSVMLYNMEPKIRLMIDKEEVKPRFSKSNTNVGYIDIGGNYIPAKSFKHNLFSSLKPATTDNIIITEDGRFLTNNTLQKSNDLLSKPGIETLSVVVNSKPEIDGLAGVIIGDDFYGPFSIKSISNIGNDKLYSILTDGLSNAFIRTTDEIRGLIKIDDGNYLLSNSVSVVGLKTLYRSDEKKALEKTAGIKVSVSKNNNGTFNVSDGGLSGIDINKLTNMSKGDAKIALMRCGLSELDAKYALMKSLENTIYSFDASQEVHENGKDKTELIKKASEIHDICDKSGLIKVAFISGDKSNIDLALGLNLITYANIRKFKLMVPEIYTMLDKLCKLLVTKRMNRDLVTVNEPDLQAAIQALDNIINSLGSL